MSSGSLHLHGALCSGSGCSGCSIWDLRLLGAKGIVILDLDLRGLRGGAEPGLWDSSSGFAMFIVLVYQEGGLDFEDPPEFLAIRRASFSLLPEASGPSRCWATRERTGRVERAQL